VICWADAGSRGHSPSSVALVCCTIRRPPSFQASNRLLHQGGVPQASSAPQQGAPRAKGPRSTPSNSRLVARPWFGPRSTPSSSAAQAIALASIWTATSSLEQRDVWSGFGIMAMPNSTARCCQACSWIRHHGHAADGGVAQECPALVPGRHGQDPGDTCWPSGDTS